MCFLRREREREEEEEGSKVLASPFTRVFKTDPSYLALVIYKSTAISVRSMKESLFSQSTFIKYGVYVYSLAFYGPVFSKGCMDPIENSG